MATLPFDDPEVKEVIDTALNVLVSESDRGAALIAAELINNILKKFLQEIFPHDFDSARFLNHQGPLGVFSSRNDALYAFRFVSKNVHRVIDLIRHVRNEAAHSPLEFSLKGQSDRLQEAYKELVQPWNSIEHVAKELIVYKLFQWVHADKDGTWREMYEKGIFTGPEEVLREIVKTQGAKFEEHIDRFRLAVGVSVLCALIVFHKKEFLTKLNGTKKNESSK